MSKVDLFLNGKRLDLIKRIGKGGEGEVYLLAGEPKKAIKIYTGTRNHEREAKVRAMVRAGLAQSSSLVSFPDEIATLKSGEFAGFTMRLVEGFHPIHELYGPKSRKINFPKADFRFLVRAATNVARAVGQVHTSTCVIGDLNHSGVLVSNSATVALIDADSFQFSADNRTYHCLVGVPEFTPPELQGKSLSGVIRNKAQDNFGLAVLIFQLLFMGRHPYAGRQSGSDLTLDQLIAANLFAYTRKRTVGVKPPGIVATLEDMPPDVADAFERAFGLDPLARPNASEWVRVLQGMEGQLSRCAANSIHLYPGAAKNCPWCRMESASGAMLFLPPLVAAVAQTRHITKVIIENAWATIKSIVVPDIENLTPRIASAPQGPSEAAKQAKQADGVNKFFGIGIAIAAICLWVAFPKVFLLWLLALGYAPIQYNKRGFAATTWQDDFRRADERWDEALSQWRANLGIDRLQAIKADLVRVLTEYEGLDAEKTKALQKLQTERRGRQLHEYLDRFLIRRASVPGIGPTRASALASFGVESAADITAEAVMAIPGFGVGMAEKLLSWRTGLERRFVYNPAPLPSDIQAQAKIEGEFDLRSRTLTQKISVGLVELPQLANAVKARLAAANSALEPLALARAQLEADLKFLDVAKPHKAIMPSTVPRHAPRPPSPPPAPYRPTSSSSVTCPLCGAHMVRRTAKRGYRQGKQFWGCSRYPTCRGTRN